MRRLSRITGSSRSSASARRAGTLPPSLATRQRAPNRAVPLGSLRRRVAPLPAPEGPGLEGGSGSRRTAFALVLLVVHDLGVDDLVLLGGRTLAGVGRGRALTRLVLGVHRGAQLLADLGELLRRRAERVDVGALEGLLDLVQRRTDLGLDLVRDLLVVLTEDHLGGVGEGVGVVAGLGLIAALAVLLGVLLRLAHHLVDVLLGQRRTARY